jgi:23S rRNA pseudouridine2604 synthase
MTNDGDIVNKILRAATITKKNSYSKQTYTDRFIDKMSNGIPILDTITRKCKVEK